MSEKQYIIGLDMMLGGYYGLRLEGLVILSDTELEMLKEELELALVEEQAMAAAYSDHDY